jgi:hypothetical protein
MSLRVAGDTGLEAGRVQEIGTTGPARLVGRWPAISRRLRWPRPGARPSKHSGIELSVVSAGQFRGHLSGTVTKGFFEPGTLFPFLACIIVGQGARRSLWLYEDEGDTISPGTIAITRRHQSVLGISSAEPKLLLQVPNRVVKAIRPPTAADLPAGASLYVSQATYDSLRRKNDRKAYAVMTTDKRVVAGVRLYKRDISGDFFLVSMFMRTMVGTPDRSTIQLSAMPEISPSSVSTQLIERAFRFPVAQQWKRIAGVPLGTIVLAVRWIDYFVEFLLRLALRSQTLTFRVAQANPGDDDLQDTIRIHPTAFPALGLRPGDQVIVNWAGSRTTARVLEDPNPVDTQESSSPLILSAVGLHLDGLLPEGFPAHLVAKVPAPMRTALGIPPSTLIDIRRRIRPAVLGQLNQLTIPVAGLILAAAAFPSVRGWPLVAGAIAAVMLGLAPLRRPRPPRGRWP